MSIIETWFPTSIYSEENLMPEEEINVLVDRCYAIKNITPSNHNNWGCDVYTTIDSHDINKDKTFCRLVNKVTEHVNLFVLSHGSNHKYTCKEAWINIYKNKQYQEHHYHTGVTFSAVYFLKAPKGSAGLKFTSPLQPDMFPIKDIKERTQLSFDECTYAAIENKLLIFRSRVGHLVTQGSNKEDRISIAFNF